MGAGTVRLHGRIGVRTGDTHRHPVLCDDEYCLLFWFMR